MLPFLHLRRNNIIVKAFFICLLFVSTICTQKLQAQTYGGTDTFGDMNQYSFDWTVVCSADGTSAVLTVTFTTAEPPGLVPQVHLGGGAFFTMSGPAPYTFTFTGLTDCDFSFQFWFAWAGGGLYASSFYDSSVLPISLLDFNLKKLNNRSIQIDWTSSTEINSDFFAVQRSTNGRQWEQLETISAAGNSEVKIDYQYIDKNIPVTRTNSSNYYYRLKLVDLDGSYEYSPTRKLILDSFKNAQISIYPNPVSNLLNLNINEPLLDSQNVMIEIYNLFGQKLFTQKQRINQEISLDLSFLPPAIYSLTITQKDQKIYNTRLLKQ